MPDLDHETLERLRRGLPLRLDRSGHFHLGDDPISHPRIHAAFLAGLDLSDSGEPTLHLGEQWCYLTVDDCPLRATAVLRDPHDAPQLRLDDGRTLPLDPATVLEDPTGLRATAPARRSGRPLRVRLSNTAAMDLSTWLEDEATLLVAGQRHHIARVPTS